jgi:hypothetical protein
MATAGDDRRRRTGEGVLSVLHEPEPKEDLGEIVTEFDEVTQQEVRWRSAKIGMVRNAPPEQKKDVRVYLDPLPHIRIEKRSLSRAGIRTPTALNPSSATGRDLASRTRC